LAVLKRSGITEATAEGNDEEPPRVAALIPPLRWLLAKELKEANSGEFRVSQG
jgi:hypothetical protein